MKDYTYNDMLKMQEEAAVRVREMKKRAAIAVENDNPASEESAKYVFPDEVNRISYPVELPEKPQEDKPREKEDKKSGILDIIKADSDSVLIVFILLLISQEETDYLTSLALLYLLL